MSTNVGENDEIAQARIALGSETPTPFRTMRIEATLVGQTPSEDLFVEAALKASEEASPISDLSASAEYRKKMVVVLVRRALQAAWLELAEGK